MPRGAEQRLTETAAARQVAQRPRSHDRRPTTNVVAQIGNCTRRILHRVGRCKQRKQERDPAGRRPRVLCDRPPGCVHVTWRAIRRVSLGPLNRKHDQQAGCRQAPPQRPPRTRSACGCSAQNRSRCGPAHASQNATRSADARDFTLCRQCGGNLSSRATAASSHALTLGPAAPHAAAPRAPQPWGRRTPRTPCAPRHKGGTFPSLRVGAPQVSL